MKKLLLLAAGAFLLTANLSSCKKGENDPFLSLKSRKSRLSGEWEVTKQDVVKSHVNSTSIFLSNTTTGSYSNGVLTTLQTNTGTNIITTSTQAIKSTYKFEKDGTFTLTEITDEGTPQVVTNVYTGNYTFLGKNKDADLKKKEALYIYYKSWVQSDVNNVSTTVTLTGINTGTTFMIDQLKSKEIILIDENSDKSGTETNTNKTTFTLTAK
jgi:hypothetical protein